ncbi:MAG: asparagine synthase (glutamine-hydrolyzing), partial [bacterium]
MCGIAGYIKRDGEVEVRTVKSMCDMIRHRGPDDEGFFVRGSVGLGMRRLSIIDIAGGHQPIFNEQGTICTVFNGEIYNYKELRLVLHAHGHKFSTRTDTEVLVHQYEESGSKCVSALNGMFAFAIWDEQQQRLFIARDRMGIKPLYYYFDGERFLFASEIKSLLVKDGIKPQLNEKSLWDYLTFRYVPEPETIWKGIRKLPPAHWLALDTGTWSLTVDRYWEIPYSQGDTTVYADESQMAEEFGTLFEDSIARQLQADVPVGILLSGGLDSSAVLAAASRLHTGKIYSFSVAFKDGGEFDELKYARQAAVHAG